MKKEDSVYLSHIFDAIERIEEYVQGIRYEDFMDNHLIQDGVIRQTEIIGEATKRLSVEIRKEHPDIPWKDIAGMRDKCDTRLFRCRFVCRMGYGSKGHTLFEKQTGKYNLTRNNERISRFVRRCSRDK